MYVLVNDKPLTLSHLVTRRVLRAFYTLLCFPSLPQCPLVEKSIAPLCECTCHFISMLSGAPTIHTSPGYYGNKRPLGINLSPMCVQNMSTTSQCGDNPTYICVVSLYCRSCAANLTTLFAPKCKQDETSLFGPDVH